MNRAFFADLVCLIASLLRLKFGHSICEDINRRDVPAGCRQRPRVFHQIIRNESVFELRDETAFAQTIRKNPPEPCFMN